MQNTDINPDHLYELAVRFLRGDDYDNAYSLSKHLQLMTPYCAKPYKILGLVQQAKGEYSFALGAYQRAILLDAKDTEVMRSMVECYLHFEDYAHAKRWLEALLALEPDDEYAKRLINHVDRKLQ